MSTRIIVKIGFCSFVGVVVIGGAAYLLSIRPVELKGAVVAGAPTDTPVDFTKPGAVHPDKLAHGPHSIAAGAMNSIKIQPERDGIHVSATASLWHRDDGNAFVWGVQVVNVNDKDVVVFERRYDDQLATMQAKNTAKPTFDDVLQFAAPAGTYIVKLTAYIIPAEGGAVVLDDPKKASLYEAAVGRGRVVIP